MRKTALKRLLPLLLSLSLAPAAQAANPWDAGPLRVAANGRYLQQADGQPFFWLGDTAWLLVQKLSREEMKAYFADRQAKGFNVVQTVVVQMLNDKTADGAPALVDGDITRLRTTPGSDPADREQYDYWDHVDYAFEQAAAHGIYLAVAPTWSHTVRRAPVSPEQAARYAAAVAERLKSKPNLIWLNGGSAKGDVDTAAWQAIGTQIKQHDGRHLMGFHPFGRQQSSTWFQDAPWLDFNMFVSGHRRYDQDVDGRKYGEDNWRYVLDDLARQPAKPTLDGEPAYENTPQGLHKAEEPYWTGDDARRYAWWAVMAGAFGHTYGENSVRQVYLPRDAKPASGAKGHFMERLDAPGARSMKHLKQLMLARPFGERQFDPTITAGDEGEKYDRVLVSRGRDHLLAYTYTGRDFKLQLGAISGKEVAGWWFNPRSGEASSLGRFKNEGVRQFDPPGDKAAGQDWVLVLDDAAKGYAAPGPTTAR